MLALAYALLLVGAEVASLATTGSLVPGARLVSGVLATAGPWGAAFAGVAEGLARVGERSRVLTLEEYAWARRVFGEALPPREVLVLTDTIGAAGRPFTFPRLGGEITLNMGEDAYADPRAHQESFVHELAHAWQLHHVGLDLALLASVVGSRLFELAGDDPYRYAPGLPYAAYSAEQQAQIVSDWFRRHRRALGSAAAVRDRRYRYIERNIRRGAPE